MLVFRRSSGSGFSSLYTLARMATLFGLAGWVGAAPAGAESGSRPQMVITSFAPFDGNLTNTSRDVAPLLKARLEKLVPGLDVSLCPLDVLYDRSAEQALQCIAAGGARPVWVLSLGEGECTVAVETQARNRDDAPGADNAGVRRNGQEITPGGPEEAEFTLFPASAMRSRLAPADASRVEISKDMGGFVCNNTAYHLATAPALSGVPFGFIHVPAHFCGPDASDPDQLARIIATMVAPELSGYVRPDWSASAMFRDLFRHIPW